MSWVSAISGPELSDVAAGSRTPLALGLDVRGDRRWTRDTVMAVDDAGYREICRTRGAPVDARRQRDVNRSQDRPRAEVSALPARYTVGG